MVEKREPQWAEALEKELKEKFPGVETNYRELSAELEIKVEPTQLKAVAFFLRDRGTAGCNYLSCLSGVDYKDHFQLVYNVFRITTPVRVMLKVDVPRPEGDVLPEVDSLVEVWPTADWHEREVYDMFGIRFQGHPNLIRILMPEDFDGGYPLRKDFVDRRPPRERQVRQR